MKLSQYISILFSQLHIEQNVLDNLPQYNIEMSSFDGIQKAINQFCPKFILTVLLWIHNIIFRQIEMATPNLHKLTSNLFKLSRNSSKRYCKAWTSNSLTLVNRKSITETALDCFQVSQNNPEKYCQEKPKRTTVTMTRPVKKCQIIPFNSALQMLPAVQESRIPLV